MTDLSQPQTDTPRRRRPTVYVAFRSDQLARQVAAALPEEKFLLQDAAAAGSTARVLLTDLPLGEIAERVGGDILQRGELGVVRIGGEGPADVLLPADFSQRELRLACRLLGEIVRLRAAQHKTRSRNASLARLAKLDPLTNLPNRRAWDDALASISPSDAAPVCIALFDLDHFKQVNDRQGHVAGDELLRRTAELLRRAIRRDDLLARIGGDEFALLAPGLSEKNAAAVVERIRRQASQASPLSAGYATGAAATPAKLYEKADEALRKAKAAGRNRTRTG